MANSTLSILGLTVNSIGDEGADALARALATNCSLEKVCVATGGPQWVGSEWWGWPLLFPTLTRYPPVSFVGGGGGTALA